MFSDAHGRLSAMEQRSRLWADCPNGGFSNWEGQGADVDS